YFCIVSKYFANFRNFQKINKRYTYSHNHAFLQCFAIFRMVSQFNIKFLFYLFIIIIHYILHLLIIHFFIIYYLLFLYYYKYFKIISQFVASNSITTSANYIYIILHKILRPVILRKFYDFYGLLRNILRYITVILRLLFRNISKYI